jgi:hypothetical protein
MLSELIAKIKEDLKDVEKNAEKEILVEHFNRTIAYLKKESICEINRFHGITL